MRWQRYRVTFRLRSPLHAGRHKVGNLQRTRRYLPGRTVRGALVARLAATLPGADYDSLLAAFNAQVAPGYFFVGRGERPPLLPRLNANELVYREEGSGADAREIDEGEFDFLFLTSWVSTALHSGQSSALDGSLHEVECLAPRTPAMDEVRLAGDLYVAGDAASVNGIAFIPEQERHDVGVSFAQGNVARAVSLKNDVLPGLQAGGERRYGFGRLELVSFTAQDSTALGDDDRGPRIMLGVHDPFPAHVLAVDEAGTPPVFDRGEAVASLEVLLGRETRAANRFGETLSTARICWAPGGRAGAGDYLVSRGDGVLVRAGRGD